MLTIGEFSRICLVTKKTLRHYDDIGLLRPEYIAENGYRYYKAEQTRTMLFICRLKSYGFSLMEIMAIINSPDEKLLTKVLTDKHRQLEADLQRASHILEQLGQDVEKLKRSIDIMDKSIMIKTITLSPMHVMGIRKQVSVQEFKASFLQWYQELEQHSPIGPPMVLYHGEEFPQDCLDVEVAVPVSDSTEGARLIPGGLYCFATVIGPYEGETFTAAYANLIQWTKDNGYQVTGTPFEWYVRGGDDITPDEFVTEIYFPIGK